MHGSTILALGRLRQENCKFKVSLCCRNPVSKTKQTTATTIIKPENVKCWQ
jgi:hypothetical protein